MSGFADFWAGRDLWRDPMIAGVLAGAVLGYIGVFVVLKRMVFVSAALSEISGVGVAFAFWLGAVLGIDPHAHGRADDSGFQEFRCLPPGLCGTRRRRSVVHLR